jgi:hypothetical protein
MLGASGGATRQQLDVLTHAARPRPAPAHAAPRDRLVVDLLAPIERARSRSSVFRGGFDLGAAEAVIDVGSDPLDLVHATAKSLLYARRDETGGVQFGLYLSIRSLPPASFLRAMRPPCNCAMHGTTRTSSGARRSSSSCSPNATTCSPRSSAARRSHRR